MGKIKSVLRSALRRVASPSVLCNVCMQSLVSVLYIFMVWSEIRKIRLMEFGKLDRGQEVSYEIFFFKEEG